MADKEPSSQIFLLNDPRVHITSILHRCASSQVLRGIEDSSRVASAGLDEDEEDEEESRSSSPASTYDDPAMYNPASSGGSGGLFGRPGLAAALGEYKTRTRGLLQGV